MGKSALECGHREAKRYATTKQITSSARLLTETHGLEGFTMDDLAARAGVSRRTLFNYFPSKIDAVLGVHPDLDPDLLAEFHAGGPHGDLISDLGVLAGQLLDTKDLSRDEVAQMQRVLMSSPRLLLACHERFTHMTDAFVEEIRTREGAKFDETRARVAIRMLAALFDLTLDHYVADADDRPLSEVYADNLRIARELLAQ
ncbi:TetR/AcrR family transcriptional regulator [Nocardioides speluncae]|uniref:TetR/AcrR family transcriptional regulator n=1 Tax=Nocardioides speluncae TaxID=2670337 RepID=UPI00137B048B|nr:TetR family transcriptional regulator [Nocardioides speluncae]